MKIIYIHQYFRKPEQGGAIRSWHLATALIKAGHTVEMITAHNQKDYLVENLDGLKAHYLPVAYDNSFGFLKRIFSFYKFSRAACQLAKKIPADLCYASSTPLTTGLTALRLKKNKGLPYYFEVRDLWPEAPVQMGYIKSCLLKTILYRLEKRIYRHAEKIIALSPGIKEEIERKTEKPVILIPNMSDTDFFRPEEKEEAVMKKFGSAGKFVVTYFGAVGKANHLEYLLDIAKYCRHKEDKVLFFIAGAGSEYERLWNSAQEKGLDNIRFLGYMNKEQLRELLKVTDAAYVSFLDIPVLQTNSPNKFFDALAAGKVCIVNTKGWLKDLVESRQCGFYADPHAPGEFLNKLKPLLENPALIEKYKKQARELAEKEFDKKILSEKLCALIRAYTLPL